MSIKQNLSRATLVIALLALTACSDLNSEEQRMLTGAALGASVGAISTVATSGCVACGAAVGGALGAGAGYVMEQIDSGPKSSQSGSSQSSSAVAQ